MSGPAFSLGGKPVGWGTRPLVVAEMSGNHNGSLDNALRIVREAAGCGADAIKLQTFTPATLTVDSSRPEFFIDEPESLWHGRRLWELYDEAHTPWEWHEPIFELARSLGLACISTAVDEQSLDFLVRSGVDAIKIASFECIHIPLLEQVARSGRPVLLSTGMATDGEIEEAVAALRSGSSPFVLLKATSAYPSTETEANVRTMLDLHTRFGCEVGLSDHSLRPYVAYAATALGASVIEKHLTLRRSDGGVDAAFSLEPQEFAELVQGVRSVWLSLGEVRYGPLPTEAASLKERPSIYAVRPLSRGERLSPENVRVIRPANGLAPKHYREIIGSRAARDIATHVPISWDLVELEERDRT